MADETRPKIPISADWVLKRIQDGKKVRLRNAVIEGDIDLNKLDLPIERIVRSSIKITNSTIQGKLDFSNLTFTGDAWFFGANFTGDSRFNRANFTGDAWFDGANFSGYARFDGANFSGDATFDGANFTEYAGFNRATFSGGAGFDRATFNRYARFNRANFSGYATFDGANFSLDAGFIGANFSGDTGFSGANFSGYATFDGANFSGDAGFNGATFSGDTGFNGATFSRDAGFNGANFSGDTGFNGATFSGDTVFNGAKLEGDVLTFRNATFILAQSQEKACRRAKNVLAKAGNRDEEEYHFYREMEAKRIQKGLRGNSGLDLGYLLFETDTWSSRKFFFYDILEFVFVQKIFGYGVHPFRLFGWWLAFVVAFAIIYSIKGAIEQPDARQWYDYLWFSIATAATPGYALYKPLGLFKIIAGIEAILGTFMWAAFITTFARKFSR